MASAQGVEWDERGTEEGQLIRSRVKADIGRRRPSGRWTSSGGYAYVYAHSGFCRRRGCPTQQTAPVLSPVTREPPQPRSRTVPHTAAAA